MKSSFGEIEILNVSTADFSDAEPEKECSTFSKFVEKLILMTSQYKLDGQKGKSVHFK
jgi:hypothetical protein